MDSSIDHEKLPDSAVVEIYNAASIILRHYYSFYDSRGMDIDRQNPKPEEITIPLEILRDCWRIIVIRDLPVKPSLIKTY